MERAARPSFISVGEGAETGSCWCCFYARHRRAAAIFSGQEEIEKAGRPPTARVWQGEEVFKQYVRDMLIIFKEFYLSFCMMCGIAHLSMHLSQSK